MSRRKTLRFSYDTNPQTTGVTARNARFCLMACNRVTSEWIPLFDEVIDSLPVEITVRFSERSTSDLPDIGTI